MDNKYDFSDLDQPGVMESLGRGAAQGATLGFADELAGTARALGQSKEESSLIDLINAYKAQRDVSREAFKSAEEANPVASMLGNLVGGAIPTAAMTVAAPITAAPTFAGSLVGGALTGGLTAAGTSERDLKDMPVEMLGGAATGATLGALGRGAIGAVKGTAKAAASTTIGKQFIDALKTTKGGTKLLGEKARQDLMKSLQGKGEELAEGFVEGVEKKAGPAIAAAKQSEAYLTKKSEVGPYIQELRDIQESLLTSKDKDVIQGGEWLRDTLNNFDVGGMIDVPIIQKILKSPAVEKIIPSARSKMAINSAKKIAEAEARGLQATTEIVPSSQEGVATRLLHTTTPEGEVKMTPSAFEDLPGGIKITPAVEESIEQVQKVKAPVIPTEMSQKDLSELLNILNDKTGVAGREKLPSTSGRGMIKSVAGKLAAQQVKDIPELGVAKQNYHALMQGLERLGIGNISDLTERYAGMAEKEIARDVKDRITALLSKAQTDPQSMGSFLVEGKLNDVFNDLAKVSPDLVAKLQPEIKAAARNLQLAQQATQFDPTRKFTFTRGIPSFAGAAIGESAHALKTSLANNTPEIIKNISSKLVASGSKTAQEVGNLLEQANMKSGSSRNALLFAIEQNPAYREVIKQHSEE